MREILSFFFKRSSDRPKSQLGQALFFAKFSSGSLNSLQKSSTDRFLGFFCLASEKIQSQVLCFTVLRIANN
ncbi:hypothetical protein ACFX12_026397 [Malus domestica]